MCAQSRVWGLLSEGLRYRVIPLVALVVPVADEAGGAHDDRALRRGGAVHALAQHGP